jgi:hypothetical protein
VSDGEAELRSGLGAGAGVGSVGADAASWVAGVTSALDAADGSALSATPVLAGATRFDAGVSSVPGSGAGSRFGDEAKPLGRTGVVPRLGGNAGEAVRVSSGVTVGSTAAATVAGGCVVAAVAPLVASPTGGGSVTSDADATPAGVAVIAKAKAHSSTRTAVRTACAGRNLAGWERPDALGLNSLNDIARQFPTPAPAANPPGVVMHGDPLSI